MNRRIRSVPPVLLAAVFSVAMVAFGLSAHRDGLAAVRYSSLAIAAAALLAGMARSEPVSWFRPRRRGVLLLAACAAIGVALAAWFRVARGQPVLPGGPTLFLAIAAGIGACEEIAWRGFVQSAVRQRGTWMAVLAAAGAHTAYKCSLFVLPDVAVRPDLPTLAAGTLTAGVIMGLMKERLGGLAFPMVAHVAFDIVAYGDAVSVPWWI